MYLKSTMLWSVANGIYIKIFGKFRFVYSRCKFIIYIKPLISICFKVIVTTKCFFFFIFYNNYVIIVSISRSIKWLIGLLKLGLEYMCIWILFLIIIIYNNLFTISKIYNLNVIHILIVHVKVYILITCS